MDSGSSGSHNPPLPRRSARNAIAGPSTEDATPKITPKSKAPRKISSTLKKTPPKSPFQPQIITLGGLERNDRSETVIAGPSTDPFNKGKRKAMDQLPRTPTRPRREEGLEVIDSGEGKFLVFNRSKQEFENPYMVNYIRDDQDKINSNNGEPQIIITQVDQLGLRKNLEVFPRNIQVIFSDGTQPEKSDMGGEKLDRTTDEGRSGGDHKILENKEYNDNKDREKMDLVICENSGRMPVLDGPKAIPDSGYEGDISDVEIGVTSLVISSDQVSSSVQAQSPDAQIKLEKI